MRAMTLEERSLLVHLMEKAGLPLPDDAWFDTMRVELIGPGRSSFALIRTAEPGYERLASDVEFRDADGVFVLASLFVDRNRVPLEVDIWKCDDTELIRLPMFPDEIGVSSELTGNESMDDYRRLSLFFLALGFIVGGVFAWAMDLLAGVRLFVAVGLIGQCILVWLYRASSCAPGKRVVGGCDHRCACLRERPSRASAF